MTAPLRIALVADPELPVPPRLYGGIERVIHFLAEGLTARGHDVTLFAHRDSQISGRLVPYRGTSSHSKLDTVRNALTIACRAAQFDVVHSFGRLAYLTPLAATATPKLMSYQRPVTPRSIHAATRLFGRSLSFTACGRHMIGALSAAATWHIVPNGVPLARFTFRDPAAADAPLVFLGRVEEIKGPHLAIDAAKRAGRRLVIAGNVPPEHQAFFDAQVKPHVDGDRVQFVGPVDDAQKNALLGAAAALLMPILWDEPFGIVMAEALACGTPVVGLRRASVPEVVDDGVTGWIVDDAEALGHAAAKIDRLSRRACRAAAEARFSDDVIVSAYEAIYREMIHQPASRESAASRRLRNV